jgi:hypothetical protein
MAFAVYWNKNRPRIRIHLIDCKEVEKRGGGHKHDQGGWSKHSTYRDARKRVEELKSKYPRLNGEPVVHCPNCLATATDLASPPKRSSILVSRIVRDTKCSRRVKELHNYSCQICGETILLADGSRYAEGHHLQPLGEPHGGRDVEANIICVCPNHHAACDFGAIPLDLRRLRCVRGHQIGQIYIDYHNEQVFRG